MSKADTGAKSAKTGARAGAHATADEARIVNLPVKAQPDRTEQVTRFVKEHPVMVIAGGLALGALAAALLPRRNRTYVAKRSSTMADAMSAAGLALAKQFLDRTEHLGRDMRRGSGALADRAEVLGRSTLHGIGLLGSAAADKLERINPLHRAPPANLADHMASRANRIKDRLFH